MSAADPTFAVAFGGGGARGLAHIHAIEAMDELGVRPVAIAGSSIGAIMGAGMASGMSGREIREFTASTLGSPTEVARRVWGSRPGSLREAVSGGFRFGQFDIMRILRSFLPTAIPETFEALKIPLQITGTDYFRHALTLIDDGDLFSAIGASAAIPGVFRPVTRNGRLLVDGGIHNPVPFDLLTGKADIIIAIDVVGAPEEADKPPSAIDLMFGASQLMMQSIIDAKLAIDQPDIFLRPPVSKFRVLDFLKVEQVLNESSALKDELKRAVETVVERRARS